MADEPAQIILHLRPLPCDVPVAIRLRQLLKTALRRDRLKCVRVEGLPTNEQEETKQCSGNGANDTDRPGESACVDPALGDGPSS
jgi:hypothetical protein